MLHSERPVREVNRPLTCQMLREGASLTTRVTPLYGGSNKCYHQVTLLEGFVLSYRERRLSHDTSEYTCVRGCF
jgi:hypothetical protein